MPSQGLLLDPNILSEETLLKIYNTAIPIPVETMLSETRYALKMKNPEKFGHIVTQVKPIFV